MSIYLISFFVLFIVMLVYLKIANRFNIVDKPNNRSSHEVVTIRGGGIVFPISILMYFVLSGFQYPIFVAAIFIISAISFVDDIKPLNTSIRLVIQFISIVLVIVQLFPDIPFLFIPLVLFILLGGVNAYNFMDGINGITASYSFINLITLLIINHFVGFIENDLLIVLLFSVVIFGFLNFRKNAICFAGDVGSVSMALIVLFLNMKLIINTSSPVFILLMLVYGLDTGLTLVNRFIRKENILSPHREHLYQKIVDITKWTHLKVSLLYSSIQLLINFIVVFVISISEIKYSLSLLIIFIMYFSYTFVKNKIVEK